MADEGMAKRSLAALLAAKRKRIAKKDAAYYAANRDRFAKRNAAYRAAKRLAPGR